MSLPLWLFCISLYLPVTKGDYHEEAWGANEVVKGRCGPHHLVLFSARSNFTITWISGGKAIKILFFRLTETYPIDVSEEGKDDVNNVVAAASPTKPEKRKRPKAEHGNGESTPVSMADLYGNIERMPQMGKFPDFGNSSPLASPLYPGSPMFHSSFDPKKSDAHQVRGFRTYLWVNGFCLKLRQMREVLLVDWPTAPIPDFFVVYIQCAEDLHYCSSRCDRFVTFWWI